MKFSIGRFIACNNQTSLLAQYNNVNIIENNIFTETLHCCNMKYILYFFIIRKSILTLKARFLRYLCRSGCRNRYVLIYRTLHKLDSTLMQRLPEKFIFTIGTKLKHTRPGTHQKPIELLSYTDKDLCVVRHLDEYIRRTAALRKGKSQLLISYIKPHNPISKDTIARWVKGVLKDADINTNNYSSHSSRAAATSYGFTKGAELTEILQAAGWSNAQTFAAYYHKPIERETLGSHIMRAFQANTEPEQV